MLQKSSDNSLLCTLCKPLQKLLKRAAIEKGAARIGPGMRAGALKRKANYEPFRAALQALELPPRVEDPMANIDNRAKAVVKTLIEKKKEILGI